MQILYFLKGDVLGSDQVNLITDLDMEGEGEIPLPPPPSDYAILGELYWALDVSLVGTLH